MKRLIIALLFICPSAFAAYTEMVIEGVKQSNGVWTTSGTMDTMGFVRKTSQVSVMGSTTTRALAIRASIPAASLSVKGIVGKLGPYGIAAVGAYDLYNWVTSNGVTEQNGAWVFPPDNEIDSYAPYYGFCKATFNANIKWDNYTLSQCVKSFCLVSGNPVPHYLTGTAPNTIHIACNNPGNEKGLFTPYTYRPIVLPPVDPSFFLGLPDLPIGPLNDAYSKVPDLIGQGIPFDKVDFTPYSEWYSDPYFKNGNWWRDRMDVSPSPAPGSPTRVRVDIGPIKIEGATNPQVVPDTGPASDPENTTAPKEETKFCDDNPGSIACQEMGEAEPEPIEPDEKQFQLDTNQSWGASNGACPASPSVTLFTGKVITFDYQPTCDFLALLRPIIIAFALMTAIFIALGRTD